MAASGKFARGRAGGAALGGAGDWVARLLAGAAHNPAEKAEYAPLVLHHDVAADEEVEHAAAEPAVQEAEARRDPLVPLPLEEHHQQAEEAVPYRADLAEPILGKEPIARDQVEDGPHDDRDAGEEGEHFLHLVEPVERAAQRLDLVHRA